MKPDIISRNGIEAALNAMLQILAAATEDVHTACADIVIHGQNTAIGALLPVEERLNQAMALYKAVIAMHRCKF